MSPLLEEIKQIPKVLLHDHLDGGIRAQTVIELAKSQGITLPENDQSSLAQWFYRESTAKDLNRCLKSFEVSCAVMQTKEALERVAYEMLEDMASDNIIYVETRFCPRLHTQNGLAYNDIIESVLRGLGKGKAKFGVEYGVILCGMFHYSDETNLGIAKACHDYLGRGVVGFDFAGSETGFSLLDQKQTINFLQQHHIPLTIHAGEADGIEPIIRALDSGAQRIGHGCRLFHAANPETIKKVIQRIIDHNLHIEINILSNLGTGAISDMASHPVKTFMDEGISVSLNTDDRLMFNNTLSEEYVGFANFYNIGIPQIVQMNMDAASSSFASSAVKDTIMAKLRQYNDTLSLYFALEK